MAMPKIEFRTQMFRGDWDQVWSQRRMLWMMEALCRVNQTHLQEFAAFKARGLAKNNYPSVYRSGHPLDARGHDGTRCLSGSLGRL
jgi:hypothetical protein